MSQRDKKAKRARAESSSSSGSGRPEEPLPDTENMDVLLSEVRRTLDATAVMSTRYLEAAADIACHICADHAEPSHAVPFSWFDVNKVAVPPYELVDGGAKEDGPASTAEKDDDDSSSGGQHFACYSCYAFATNRCDDAKFEAPDGVVRLCEVHVDHLLAARGWLALVTRPNVHEADDAEKTAYKHYSRCCGEELIVDMEN